MLSSARSAQFATKPSIPAPSLLVRLGAACLLTALAGSAAVGAERGLVCLRDVAPGVVQDIRYAGFNNFVGAPAPGYEAAECWLARPAAEALARVQAAMEKTGKTLVVYDCYRPVRAVRSFLEWAKRQGDKRDPAYFPRVDGSRLVSDGYIAARSAHSTGLAVDLSFRDLGAAEPADTGGLFDLFDPISHTNAKIPEAARRNRNLLVAAMAGEGFVNYAAEWWHFARPGSAPPQDVPVRACGPK